MTYLDALAAELAAAGIPAARRRRILAEFADHLHEDPGAELGAPRALARQFADELGTRLARAAAVRVFSVLALAAVALSAMILAVGRMRGLTLSAQSRAPTPGWAAALLIVAFLAGEVALAAGGTGLLRAWWLRGRPVINAREATVLLRRAAVGAAAGALTLLALPTLALAHPHAAGGAWTAGAWGLTGCGLLALAALLPSLRSAARLRPAPDGPAGDLREDVGPWAPAGLTPARIAGLVALAIVIVVGGAGAAAQDPFDGLARGLADAAACLAGYGLLGRYLGLRPPAGR
ncbi:MAG TPA: hypothetical protein VFN36_03380 [Solirubrobacteraceae bacterium]|nr:hypothetical protein [Solirubrobacteraceae bacterium]